MGCTPSIHVSQTGVVYCRESDESNSPMPSSMSGNNQTHNHAFKQTTTVIASSSLGRSAALVEQRATVSVADCTEADAQTAKYILKGSQLNMLPGPIHIKKTTMSVLLVFGKEDAQSEGFWWAADQAGYTCSLVRNAENALELFLEKQHDVVIIDHRPHKFFDPDALCRSLRATQCSEHSVIVAVTRRCRDNEEEPAVRPLLNAGFTRRFVECTKTSVCANELLMLEHSDVRLLQQKRAAKALVTALDHCSEAVDITSEDPRQFQFVNSAYERLFGCSSEEVLGKDISVGASDKNKPEVFNTINAQLKKGKVWEGTLWSKKKTGEQVQNLCKVIPVTGHKGQLQHYVTVRSAKDLDQVTGNNQYLERRRESATGIHSMTIEAPITKVINIINATQQNSPAPVAQALDKVLDMLRSSELYSPEIDQQLRSDQIISGLVGGLMSAESSISFHSTGSTRRRSSITDFQNRVVFGDGTSPTPTDHVPSETESVLEKEPCWDLDVFALERLTKKRPLRYLAMKTFQRFGVLSFLRCSERVMANWLQLIEANYHSGNTYHNSTHAADVVHATAYFLSCHRVKEIMDEIDAVAALLAAAVHDVDHPGRTNTYLVNSSSPLAILYNDAAVLENHHSSLAFRLTSKDPIVNIFKNLDREDYRALRQMIVDMVLATEMTKHFEHLSKFNSAITKIVKTNEDDMTVSLSRSSSSPVCADLSSPENKTLIKRILIKCADVSNPCRPFDLCKEWAVRISEEYFKQSDDEKQRSLPVVMPAFDRKTCNIPKSQTGFIELFINDMFEAWDCFCDIPELMGHMQTNYNIWKEMEEKSAGAPGGLISTNKLDSKSQPR